MLYHYQDAQKFREIAVRHGQSHFHYYALHLLTKRGPLSRKMISTRSFIKMHRVTLFVSSLKANLSCEMTVTSMICFIETHRAFVNISFTVTVNISNMSCACTLNESLSVGDNNDEKLSRRTRWFLIWTSPCQPSNDNHDMLYQYQDAQSFREIVLLRQNTVHLVLNCGLRLYAKREPLSWEMTITKSLIYKTYGLSVIFALKKSLSARKWELWW